MLCGGKAVPSLPTRVIAVGAADTESHLILSESKPGKYVALTHVWGGLVPVRTTTTNIQDHLSQLPLSTLPPTFRDAVLITRHLKIEYLWIDAICIIQDSVRDWQAESSRMGEVYRNATITIAAVDADNSQAGFIKQRTRLSLNMPSVALPPPETSPRNLHIEVVSRDPLAHVDSHSPLSGRAWCLQEKLLSPRILYFGAHQTYFSCNTITHLEAYGISLPDTILYNSLSFGKSSLAHGMHNLRENPTEYAAQSIWHRVVNEYTTRSLTKPEDKLPALSGLASEFAQITGYHYLAGMWLETLTNDLLWGVQDPLERPAGTFAIYTAPSWSWASYHGPLSFGLPIPSRPRILKVETTLASLNPFGQVSDGVLVIHARCKRAVVRYQEKSIIPDFTHQGQGQSLFNFEGDFGREIEIGRCSFDYLSDCVMPTHDSSKNPKIVFCLSLPDAERDVRPVVIIIMPVDDGRGYYRRVGIGYVQITALGKPMEAQQFDAWYTGSPAEVTALQAKDLFDGCKEQEWTIV